MCKEKTQEEFLFRKLEKNEDLDKAVASGIVSFFANGLNEGKTLDEILRINLEQIQSSSITVDPREANEAEHEMLLHTAHYLGQIIESTRTPNPMFELRNESFKCFVATLKQIKESALNEEYGEQIAERLNFFITKLEAEWKRRPIKKKLMWTFITIIFLSFLSLLIFMLTSCNDDNGGSFHGKIIKNAVKDVDGNKYDAVKIGNQVWMAENLKTTKYDNGTPIPIGDSGSKGGGYRYYPGGESANVKEYGYLYDWNAVMNGQPSSNATPSGVQGICPKGWHMPSESEWQDLIDYVSNQIASGKLSNTSVAKALSSTTGWESIAEEGSPGFNSSTNNSTGFSAMPAGGVYLYGNPDYIPIGCDANFWSTSSHYHDNAILLSIYHYGDRHLELGHMDIPYGYSVRCIRD